MKTHDKFNCTGLNTFFNVDGDEFVAVDTIIGCDGFDGEKNPFYGRHHTEETKQILRERTNENLKNPKYRNSRACFGEKNGMYGSARFGDMNPMFGKVQSSETRDKIRKHILGRYAAGAVNPQKGKSLTESTKEKIAAKNCKTYELTHPNGKRVKIVNLEKYSREHDLNPIMLGRVFHGIAINHRGYTK